MEDILPLGSIVKLKNNKTFVIIGYISYKNNEDGAYDYICCLPHAVFRFPNHYRSYKWYQSTRLGLFYAISLYAYFYAF